MGELHETFNLCKDIISCSGQVSLPRLDEERVMQFTKQRPLPSNEIVEKAPTVLFVVVVPLTSLPCHSSFVFSSCMFLDKLGEIGAEFG